MTNGDCSEGKALAGHSTNWVKLNKKTAFTWYSGEVFVCTGRTKPNSSNKNGSISQILVRLVRCGDGRENALKIAISALRKCFAVFLKDLLRYVDAETD